MDAQVLGLVLLDDAVQVVNVAGQLANRATLVLDDFLIQEVGHIRIVRGLVVVGVGNLLVDVVALFSQDLLVAEGDFERGNFVAVEQRYTAADFAVVQLANCGLNWKGCIRYMWVG